VAGAVAVLVFEYHLRDEVVLYGDPTAAILKVLAIPVDRLRSNVIFRGLR